MELEKKERKKWFKENWSREKNRKKEAGPEKKKRERNDEQNKRGARRVSCAFNLYIYSISRVGPALMHQESGFWGERSRPSSQKKRRTTRTQVAIVTNSPWLWSPTTFHILFFFEQPHFSFFFFFVQNRIPSGHIFGPFLVLRYSYTTRFFFSLFFFFANKKKRKETKRKNKKNAARWQVGRR